MKRRCCVCGHECPKSQYDWFAPGTLVYIGLCEAYGLRPLSTEPLVVCNTCRLRMIKWKKSHGAPGALHGYMSSEILLSSSGSEAGSTSIGSAATSPASASGAGAEGARVSPQISRLALPKVRFRQSISSSSSIGVTAARHAGAAARRVMPSSSTASSEGAQSPRAALPPPAPSRGMIFVVLDRMLFALNDVLCARLCISSSCS